MLLLNQCMPTNSCTCSYILEGHAEFFNDSSNNDRVYLGIKRELMQHGFVGRLLGDGLETLYPPNHQSSIHPSFQPINVQPHPQMLPAMGGYQAPPVPGEFQSNMAFMAPGFPEAQQDHFPANYANEQPIPGSFPGNFHLSDPQPADNNEDQMDQDGDEDEAEVEADQSPVDTTYIKRPPNAWILFRQAHHSSVAKSNPGANNNTICKQTLRFLLL